MIVIQYLKTGFDDGFLNDSGACSSLRDLVPFKDESVLSSLEKPREMQSDLGSDEEFNSRWFISILN